MLIINHFSNALQTILWSSELRNLLQRLHLLLGCLEFPHYDLSI